MDTPSFPGVSRTETPVARPPSPPYIHIPTVADQDNAVTLNPITTTSSSSTTFDLGLGNHISRADVLTITQNRVQLSPRTQEWTYESRRQAQPILSFLYLGPASVARDTAFLRRAGITMLLAARDSRQAAARLLAVSKSAAELGLDADYVDVAGRAELISGIPLAVGKINQHLLGRGGQGKVLVCCETGNERSAALVAAYIMTMYDADLVRALQFIHYRRFCTNFDDDIKFLLRSYGDIVAARRMVDGGGLVQQQQQGRQENQQRLAVGEGKKQAKRGISDTSMDEDEELADGPESDLQRFSGRHLTPFVDSGRGAGDEAMGLGG
ncbi:phosphatases II [Coniochaeta ligniaria NRRL 30616]|uniref:Phosphatases II n=1 Tax=Coniochaeta ligniaria NRRL 30616 TaxID=1408157 RepID=A0A1J7J4Y6_9PEZI|nr:phosphatases II [Coniochaeta ligniaria NRRL 30616]